MALSKIYKFGVNGGKLSIFNNDSYYKDIFQNKSSDSVEFNTTNATTLFSLSGTDYSNFFENAELNVDSVLFNFSDNSKVIFRATQKKANTDGYNVTKYATYGDLIYISSIGENTVLISGDFIYRLKRLDNVIETQNYFALAINDEIKEAYFIRIGQSGYAESVSGNGITVKSFIYTIGGRTSAIYRRNYNFFNGKGSEYDSDPWSDAGYAGIGGGDGTFDFKSDVIALPDLPSIDAVSSGFLQLFTGNLSSILALSSYMWSTSFFDSIVKITSNPIDIIMGLYMYPFFVPATNQKYIRAGNVITNISMGVPDSQILEIDCGELPIPNFYGAYLDYEPFTKCDLFLPYCGTFPLSMDDIAGKTINVKYRIDLLTGVCGAYVIVDGTVKYNYTGTCAINIPISSRSFENVYNAIMGVVGSMHGGSSFGLPSVGSIAGAVTSGKNQIQHGGNCSGNAGYLGVQKPYLIFSVPRVAIPKGLNKYTGYPIFATYKLADLKGYTEIEQIHLENMGQATQEEIDKIISMLEGGVIL